MDAGETTKQYYIECCLCVNIVFNLPQEFANHLRNNHCSREGGSFVCLYGENQVCSSLPVEGVSDADYEKHIYKHHIFIKNKYQRHKRQTSSMSSVLDLSVDFDKWNFYSASQNLAAILNNPNKIKQKDFFTKLWGEGFAEVSNIPNPSFLPNITKQHFDPYLKKLLKKYRRRSKLKKRLADVSCGTETQNFPLFKGKSLERLTFDIPDVFLKKKFDLSSVETFNTVFPRISECIKSANNSCSNESLPNPSNRSKLLQEKLSHYLDMVEIQIAKQVSSKSDAFFHTMTSHDALMENLSQTITKVRTLRSKIQSIDNTLVKDSLKILKGMRSRNNYFLVLRKLKIMATVYQTQPTVKLLLSAPDYVAALDLIYTTKDLLNNELAGIQCFRHVSSELNEVIKMIDALMTGELERYATADLNRPLYESEVITLEKDKLLCIIMGMLRRQCFSFVDSYWRELYSAIKTTIKQSVIEIVAVSDTPVFKNANADVLTLDEQLKLLTVEEWITLLRNTGKALTILLERIKSAYEVMTKAVVMCARNVNESQNSEKNYATENELESFLDEENQKIIYNKLSHLITSACQYASERYAHLLSKRSLTDDAERNNGKNVSTFTANNWLAEQATLEQLNEVSNYVDDLCRTCRSLNPNESVFMTLKSAFTTEATKFMKKFHEERLKKIDMILEHESWKQTQVPLEFQSLVNQISKTGKFTTYKVDKNTDNVNKAADILYIVEEKFVVIGTVLLLINVIAEYCVRAEDITLSVKCLLRYLTELLLLFNRKSCKLVLGGEAVSEKTGLKKITSSNLALLIRALQLLLRLTPQIRNHFINLLPEDSQQTISCLDRVSEELRLHIKDVNIKLLSIPSQIIVTELKNWEAKPPVPSKAFQNLSRSLKKLHDVISFILTPEDIYNLYRKINIHFKDTLRERIIKMNIINDNGPQHGVIITELIFYLQDLKKINALPENELNETSMNDLWM